MLRPFNEISEWKNLCVIKTKKETSGRGVAAQGNTVVSTMTSNGRTKATTGCLKLVLLTQAQKLIFGKTDF